MATISTDKYTLAVTKIVEEQTLIIGPIAKDLAKRAQGIKGLNGNDLYIEGDPILALGSLVGQFERLFGKASVDASRAALKRTGIGLLPEELPSILR